MFKPHYLIYLLLLLFSCQSRVADVSQTVATNAPVKFTVLQLNDVYEIAPLEGGKVGGLARVATVLKQLKKENPNTIAVMAGDFMSPSFVGTLKMDGERVAGKQMVETLNAMGLDYATFGNHEFDFSKLATFQSRVDLSDFTYVSSNARQVYEDGSQHPFKQNGKDVPAYAIHEFTNADGSMLKVAIVGVLLPFARQDYLAYDDITNTFKAAVQKAENEADVVLGLTHLNIGQDIQLAKDVPGLPLFMGGHEHENSNNFIGSTAIMKADANAKTVYVHRFTYYPECGVVEFNSELVPIDASIPAHPPTQMVVDKWLKTQNELLDKMGYDANAVLTNIDYTLEGKEVDVRSRQTNYGTLAMKAVQSAWPNANAYVMNSGSLRLDDDLSGTITQYDVLRSFPFGGPVVGQKMKGHQLSKLLEIGTVTNREKGGYLQVLGCQKENGKWMVNGQAINPNQEYSVVLPGFLAAGKEENLGFLGDINMEKRDKLADNMENDIRSIVIAYFKAMR